MRDFLGCSTFSLLRTNSQDRETMREGHKNRTTRLVSRRPNKYKIPFAVHTQSSVAQRHDASTTKALDAENPPWQLYVYTAGLNKGQGFVAGVQRTVVKPCEAHPYLPTRSKAPDCELLLPAL